MQYQLHVNDLKCDNQKGPMLVAGSFAPNGSSAVSAASNKGTGWSVARTGAGTFRVTFSESVPTAIFAEAGLQLSTPDDKFAEVKALTNTYLDIAVWDKSGAAATDVTAAAGNRINFLVMLQSVNV